MNYQKFKGKSRFRLELAIVIVLALVVLLVFVFPRFDRESKIEKEASIVFVESIDIPQVKLQKMNLPTPRPVIPIMSPEPDLDIDSEYLDSLFNVDVYKNTPPPPPLADYSEDTVIFVPYDEAPEVIGSIADYIVYPQTAKDVGIEGTVIVQAFIDDKGIVKNCIIMKGLPGTGLDEAAKNAIMKTKWKPALQRDRKVGVWIAIPVTFKLNK